MKRKTAAWVGAVLLCMLAGAGQPASALIITLEAPTVLSISDATGPFTLTFPDFVSGTVSGTQTVVYRVQANNMTAGAVQGAVSARLEQTLDRMEMEADVNGYQNLGGGTFAVLEEAISGYQAIQASETSLADKVAGTGSGDASLDGNLTVTWRARLTAEAPAGQQSRFLVVTVREGS